MRMKQDSKPDRTFHFTHEYWSSPRLLDCVTLYQIGDIGCDKGYVVGKHVQTCYEISYVVSGRGWFSADGRRYPVEAGDVFVSLPRQVHGGRADSADPFRYFYLGFRFGGRSCGDGALACVGKLLANAQSPVVHGGFGIRSPFQQVLTEMSSEGSYSDMMIGSYLLQIIVKVCRSIGSCRREDRDAPLQEGNQGIVRRTAAYLDDNILNISDLTQVSGALGYSYSYLSHVFSKETGLTLQSYYARKRIEKATELLRSGGLNVTCVADKLQYQSIHSFSKAFKKMMGYSPAQYQKQHML